MCKKTPLRCKQKNWQCVNSTFRVYIRFHCLYGLKNRFTVRRIFSFNLIPPLGSWLSERTQGLQGLLYPLFSAVFGLIASLYCWIKLPDYIYTRNFIVCVVLSLFCGRGVFYEEHEFSSTKVGIWLKKLVLKNIGGVVCITGELGGIFDRLGIDNIVSPNGVELMMFPDGRVSLANPPYRFTIGYVGRLYEPKGVNTLVEAMKYHPQCLLYVVGGTPPEVGGLQEYVISRGLRNVAILGYIKPQGARRMMPRFDVLVMPYSAKDNTHKKYISPLKMFEYMASRRPIVASDIPSLREVLTDDDAVFVEPDNPVALAEGITKVLMDGDLGHRLADNAYKKVLNYTWENRAKTILEFMDERS